MMKIGVVISGGGHLDQALELLEAFDGHDVFFITYDLKSMVNFKYPKIRKTYFLSLYGPWGIRLWVSFFINFFEVFFILLKERPRILFSTGSEIAFFPFLLGKLLFRSQLLYLETICRVGKPSVTAKAVYPLSDLFLVQWESLLKFFGPKAQYVGRVF